MAAIENNVQPQEVNYPLFSIGDCVCDIGSRMRWKVVNVIIDDGDHKKVTYQCIDVLHGVMRYNFPETELYPHNPIGWQPDLEYLLNLLKPVLIIKKKNTLFYQMPEFYDVEKYYYYLQELEQVKRIYDGLYLCSNLRRRPRENKNKYEIIESSGEILRKL